MTFLAARNPPFHDASEARTCIVLPGQKQSFLCCFATAPSRALPRLASERHRHADIAANACYERLTMQMILIMGSIKG